ncbi:MAG: tetraacyldisaccharide 4'-kinase [Terracidiphilus sp.]
MNHSAFARRFLLPLVPLYQMGLALRDLSLLAPARRLRYPVVSIGNLSTGGAGKTPLTIALAWALERHGIRVDILSRGYGREGDLPTRVEEEGSAAEYGDEPLLMAREAEVPVYVAPQRYDAGLLAEAKDAADAQAAARALLEEQPPVAAGAANWDQAVEPGSAMVLVKPELEVGPFPAESSADPDSPGEPELPLPRLVHLLDDGFQHRQLARDVDILLLNSHDWQDWLLPAGNLREPLEAARRASVIAIPANEPELEVALHFWGWTGPIWLLHRIMEVPKVSGPVAAFCGIARPEQFFEGLESAGMEIAARFAFPDHFTYTRPALDELLANAQAAGAHSLITTEKDLVRLGKMTALFPKSMPLATARLRIKIENQAEAINWLIKQLAPRPES